MIFSKTSFCNSYPVIYIYIYGESSQLYFRLSELSLDHVS